MSSERWSPLESLNGAQVACRRQGADASLLAFTRIAHTALTGHRPLHMIPTVMVSPDKTGLHARSKIRLASYPRSGNTLLRYEEMAEDRPAVFVT